MVAVRHALTSLRIINLRSGLSNLMNNRAEETKTFAERCHSTWIAAVTVHPYGHHRRHVYRAGMGVLVLKMTASEVYCAGMGVPVLKMTASPSF